MYAYEWEESLRYLFCRTPYYLLPIDDKDIPCQIWNHGDSEGCEWIGDYGSYSGCENQIFRVEIIYDRFTKEIEDFCVTRECNDADSHFRSHNAERSVSKGNKSSFYSVFRPLITKSKPQTRSDVTKDKGSSADASIQDKEDDMECDVRKMMAVVRRWCDNGDVYIPDLLIAGRYLLKHDCLDNDSQIALLNRLKSMEQDIKAWGLYAHTIALILRGIPDISKDVADGLKHIKTIAEGIAEKGVNYWQYQLSYNPAQEIVNMLD